MTDESSDPVGRWLGQFAAAHPGAQVLDVGGGSGTRAVPLALSGCSVLVVDASTDALASLARRAAEAGVPDGIRAVQADADQLASVLPAASVDLVLYHHVVQHVDDPARSLAAAVDVLRPGGTMSILVPGRLALVLAEALAGRYEEASAMLRGTAENDRRYDVPSLRGLMEQAGLAVESVRGVGVVAALSTGRGRPSEDGALTELERQLGRHPVLGQVGGDLHGLGLRPAG